MGLREGGEKKELQTIPIKKSSILFFDKVENNKSAG